jgi:hypothetical protein
MQWVTNIQKRVNREQQFIGDGVHARGAKNNFESKCAIEADTSAEIFGDKGSIDLLIRH